MKVKQLFPGLVAGLLLSPFVAMAASTARFNRYWQQASLEADPADDMAGRWDGYWFSHAHGHHGALRCVVTRLQERQYSAKFHAQFWGVFRLGRTVLLETYDKEDRFEFKGETPVGWYVGGKFEYSGHATPSRFYSTYSSCCDHGHFELTRPLVIPSRELPGAMSMEQQG
jgi:hypothetical protein